MKTKICIFFALLFGFYACTKDSINGITSSSGVTYQQSLNNWQAYKQKVNNNYTYTVTTASWAGFSTQTKLTIRKGVVTERDYAFYTQTPGTGSSTITKTWSEVAGTLNTHGQYEGAEILTMDEVYTKAKTEWLAADKNQNKIYFETKNNGMISSAGFVPNNCADDCFNGITIKEIVGI